MKINRSIIKTQFRRLLSNSGPKKYILWVGTPTVAPFLDLFDPTLIVYNPVDRYYAFPFVNRAKILDYERVIASKSDIIICTSEPIRNDLLPYNKRSFTVTHGVDFEHFNSAFSIEGIPDDIRSIPRPIIGYFGGLSERVNYKLIYDVAIRYPNANIVLIGRKISNLEKIEKLSNVHILGFKDFAGLPAYLKQFTVCLIPYHVNELMEGVDPIKLREYLSLGKPVVSVDLPEVRKFEGLVYIGKNEEDFLKKVGIAMLEDNSVLVGRRMVLAKKSDWDYKMQEVSKIIVEMLERKNQGQNGYWAE